MVLPSGDGAYKIWVISGKPSFVRKDRLSGSRISALYQRIASSPVGGIRRRRSPMHSQCSGSSIRAVRSHRSPPTIKSVFISASQDLVDIAAKEHAADQPDPACW